MCDVGGGVALVCGCTSCSGGVGQVHIGGRRATGCSYLWLLPVSSAFGKCCRGTNVGKARLLGHVMDGWTVVGVVGLVRSTRFSTAAFVLDAGPRLAMSGVSVKVEFAWKSGSMPVRAW